ncbi:MAG: hypothetical protein KTR31_09285 [Myxococcales bacterium]|nr:hypothetical protein [Myxococcales bacterium]
MHERHPFYRLPKPLIALATLALSVLALVPVAAAVRWPWLWLAFPLIISWGWFASTPLLRALGVYRYYSPFLCAMWPSKRRLDIHLGTSFDHAFALRPSDAGRTAQAKVLAGALDGLIAIADDVDRGHLDPDVRVEGSSWFFSPSTARRLGFRIEQPHLVGRLIPWLIVLDIAAMYSFTRGRLAWPPRLSVRRAATTAGELLAHRDQLTLMRDRLRRHSA